MIWLSWVIKAIFCKHEFLLEEAQWTNSSDKLNNIKVSATCKKCGWHRSYFKF